MDSLLNLSISSRRLALCISNKGHHDPPSRANPTRQNGRAGPVLDDSFYLELSQNDFIEPAKEACRLDFIDIPFVDAASDKSRQKGD